jgi:hypothetical protein
MFDLFSVVYSVKFYAISLLSYKIALILSIKVIIIIIISMTLIKAFCFIKREINEHKSAFTEQISA